MKALEWVTFANIYLEAFDYWVMKSELTRKFGVFYLRYADNLLFLSQHVPDKFIAAIKEELGLLGLSVKNKIGGPGWQRITKPWKFLGFNITKTKQGFKASMDINRAKELVHNLRHRRARSEMLISKAAYGFAQYNATGGESDLEESLKAFRDPIEAIEDWIRRKEMN
jgi:hypothetical protein